MNTPQPKLHRLLTLAPLPVLALLAAASPARANDCSIPIYPGPIEHVQPDGSRVTVRGLGNGHKFWLEDEQGFPAVIVNGALVYAELDADGALRPTSLRVGSADPFSQGLQPHVRPTSAMGPGRPSAASASGLGLLPGTPQHTGGGFPLTTGTQRNLVVLIRWSNHGPTGQNRTLPTQADVHVIMNQLGGSPTLAPTGSVRDLYLENSYNQLTLDSTVRDWISVSQSESYVTGGTSHHPAHLNEAIHEALNALDATTNFSTFDTNNDGWIDSITILHSGYGAEFLGLDQYGTNYLDRLWSHKSTLSVPWMSAEGVRVADYNISPGLWSTSGSGPFHLGTVSHELGHFFGIPDLYDVDFSSRGTGNWCLMGSGSWGFTNDQLHPSHMSAWAKIKMGWIAPTEVNAGALSIPAVETTPTVLRIQSGYPEGEYLLLENRQATGFESTLPGAGLAVWHIDDKRGMFSSNVLNIREGFPGQAGWPGNANHYRTALLQADTTFDLETNFNPGDALDLFRSGWTTQITPSTTPSTNSYRDGNWLDNSNSITSISASGATMTATLANPNLPIITTTSIGLLPQGTPVSIQLAATGTFLGPLTWLERRAYWNYTRQVFPVPGFTISGVAQNWRANDGVWELVLPFPFPYYDRTYTKVYVNANGFVDLHDADAGEWGNHEGFLRAAKRIAPLWDDVYTNGPGGDIFVDSTSVPGRVTIGWRAHTWNGALPLEFGLALDSNGNISFRYGAGCTGLTPTVGISRGENNEFDLVPGYNQATTLTNANLVRYTLSGSAIPEGLTLSPSGLLSGTSNTPTGSTLIVQAIDARRRIRERALTWSVAPDCNLNGIPDATDISSGSSTDIDGNGIPDECTGAAIGYCFGTGSPVACPCGNNAPPGALTGCLNSLGLGARLAFSGTPRVSADTFVLSGSGMPNSSCLYFQGTNFTPTSLFGDGLRCATGTVIRLGTKTNVAGASSYPGSGDPSISVRGLVPSTGGMRTYQAWYRNAAAFCTSSTFNTSNGVRVVWAP